MTHTRGGKYIYIYNNIKSAYYIWETTLENTLYKWNAWHLKLLLSVSRPETRHVVGIKI